MTPLLDDLRSRLKSATEEQRGRAAELSRWLADHYPGKASSYKVTLADFLSGKSNLGGELTLAVSAWLDGLKTTLHHTPKRRTARSSL